MKANEDRKNMTYIAVSKNPCGRPRKIKTAGDLWDMFNQYCDYIDSNPWQVKSASNSLNDGGEKKNNSIRQDVRVVQRAYTLYGFCAFAGIFSKWADFKRNNIQRRGFREVINAIENVVCAQQVDGALINQFDGNIVARLNSLADKQVNEIVGKDGEEFKFPKLTIEDIEELKKINGL